MKLTSHFLWLGLLFALVLTVPAKAQDVSFQYFYDNLGSSGNWVQIDGYGYCWQPNVSDANWAPYTQGHWVYTGQGWTWVSDESWGWATYHYGRWANVDGFGWVWYPGYVWAPAWVSWRSGGGYCGWAPLPPESCEGFRRRDGGAVSIGISFGNSVDVDFHIGAGCYNFVRTSDMGNPHLRGAYVDRRTNYTVINHTTNITNISYNNNKTVMVNGPSLAKVNARATHQIPQMQLQHTAARTGLGHSEVGNTLNVFAPRVNATTATTAKPERVSRQISSPKFNRGSTETKPLRATDASTFKASPQSQPSVPAKAQQTTVRTVQRAPSETPAVRSLPKAQPAASSPSAVPKSHAPTQQRVLGTDHPFTSAHPQSYRPAPAQAKPSEAKDNHR